MCSIFGGKYQTLFLRWGLSEPRKFGITCCLGDERLAVGVGESLSLSNIIIVY